MWIQSLSVSHKTQLYLLENMNSFSVNLGNGERQFAKFLCHTLLGFSLNTNGNIGYNKVIITVLIIAGGHFAITGRNAPSSAELQQIERQPACSHGGIP